MDTNTETPNQNKKYAIIAIISVLVLATLATSIYFVVKYYKVKEAPKQEVKKEVVLKGQLMLSMLPRDIKDGIPLTYTVDASSTVITPVYQYNMKDGGTYLTHTSLSPNKQFYVTGGIPVNVDPKKAANFVGLYSGHYGGALTGIKPEGEKASFGNSPNSRGIVLRLPSIGDHGGILYATAPKGTKEINFSWEIRYNNGQGKDTQVAIGLSPRWVSPKEFVYLTEKSIRIHNLETGTDSVVDVLVGKNNEPYKLTTNMTIGVSRDGKKLAINNPEEGIVYMFDKEGDSFVFKRQVFAFGFWPTFSPDGKVLAIQSVADVPTVGSDSQARIYFYNLEEQKPRKIEKYIDLSNFQNDYLFITDWY